MVSSIEETRQQEPEPENENSLTRNAFMACSEMMPANFDSSDKSAPFIDLEHNWLEHRKKYTSEELNDMHYFFDRHKKNIFFSTRYFNSIY